MSGPRLFASLFAYAAHKTATLSGEPWDAWLARVRPNPEGSVWSGFGTLKNVEQLGEETLTVISGSTLITKARSRVAGAFLESEADVWVTIDDDVYADREVCRRLVMHARRTRAIVSAPCALRAGAHLNVGFREGSRVAGELVDGELAGVTCTGLGLVAMHRDAIDRTAKAFDRWIRADEHPYPAIFLETTQNGQWVGEDFAFCDRATRALVPLYALTEAPTCHAGRRAKLGRDLAVYVDPETARTMGGE